MATFAAVNPGPRSGKRHKRRRRGPLAGAALLAHQRKVARGGRSRRRNPGVATISDVPAGNPGKRKRHGGRRHFGRGMGLDAATLKSALRDAIPVLIGIYGSRYATRAVLGSKDAGVMGYGANAVGTIGLSGIASIAGFKRDAPLIAAGGTAALLLRVLVEHLAKSALADGGGFTVESVLMDRNRGMAGDDLDLAYLGNDQDGRPMYLSSGYNTPFHQTPWISDGGGVRDYIPGAPALQDFIPGAPALSSYASGAVTGSEY